MNWDAIKSISYAVIGATVFVVTLSQCTEAGKTCMQQGGSWNVSAPGGCVPETVLKAKYVNKDL